MAKYDIFISYRREGGYDTAKHLYDLLTRDGYKVSFDIDTLRNGDFDKSLLERIDECKDFILIVDAHAFERTLEPSFNPKNDWLRQELSYAIKQKKNIIPIFLKDVNGFPANLPSDISAVSKKNGPEYNRYYFNDFYNRLKQDFLTTKKSIFKKYLPYIVSFFAVLCVVGGIYTKTSRTNEHQRINEQNINGHEYVDLGLSVKWAKTNLGASLSHELGSCYSWGSLENIRPEIGPNKHITKCTILSLAIAIEMLL